MSAPSTRTPGSDPDRALDTLLAYPGALHPEHLADLRKSGLTDETIAVQRIHSISPGMIERLLGFNPRRVVSAYLLPFADPRGEWMPHVRMKVFPAYTDSKGRTVKYLGPRSVPPRLFYPIATLDALSDTSMPIYLVEGCKKSLSVCQLGLPAVGFEGIEGWHLSGSRELLPDFDSIALRGRTVDLVPDADVQTNPDVARGAERFAEALEARGARVRLVVLPLVASGEAA